MQRGQEEGGDVCVAENAYMCVKYDHQDESICQRVVKKLVDLQEKMGTLEAQVKQLGLQAAQDCERMVKDRTVTLQLLHKVSLLPLINLALHITIAMNLFHNSDAWHACSYEKLLKAPGCPCWFCLVGARQIVCPGEEVPHLDRGEKLPKAQQHH